MAGDILTAEQIGMYQDAFVKFDTDRDGVVTSKEIGLIMKYVGQNPSDAEIQVGQ